MRIGILTGGGDVPGLNSVIKSVTYRATEIDAEVVGIRRGWEGLTHLDGADDPRYVMPLDRRNTRPIDRTGGTVLHTSRTNPRKMRGSRLPTTLDATRAESLRVGEDVYDLTPLVLENLGKLGVDHLVAIGGDDTLSYAKMLDRAGFPVVAVPKTMDNDVRGTEYCIGFSTAVARAKEAVNRQRTTIGSHERIGVFRIFGRDAGFTALYTAFVTSVRCVVPEFDFELDTLAETLAADRRANPSGYAIVIASEGAMWAGGSLREVGEPDAYGHRHKMDVGEALASEINVRTGVETIHSDLTYDLRSGEPDALDQLVATTFANMAVDLIVERRSGTMTAVVDGRYAAVPIPDPELGPRKVDASLYNLARFRPHYRGRIGQPLLFAS
jgi:6-phosphofructokinase 1